MYLNDSSDHDIKGGLLRLHSTYRHDLKCYTSDEGRCQKTAASFLKGLLEFEGALAPILAIMVQNDPVSNRMLDDSSAALGILESLSDKLNSLMHYNGENMLDHFIEQYG
jgi:inositol hexakisphosphate/diphosphoinositol-pentakisphosphate kinase